MAELSIGNAIGAGFGVIRRRPGAVLLWGLLQTAVLGVMFAVMAPVYADMLAQAAARTGGAAPPTPDLANLARVEATIWLFNIFNLLVAAVLYCAVFRAVIHPDQGRFGYLRLGKTELVLFLLIFGAYIGFLLALVVAMIPAALLVGALVAFHANVAAVIVGILLGLAALVASVYVALRFCLIGPMMVDDGKIHVFSAWRFTKGRAGALFLMALALLVMLIVLQLVVIAISLLVGVTVLGGIAGSTAAIAGLLRQGTNLLPQLAPFLAVGAAIVIPLYGALLAVMGAPWARAYLDFRGDPLDAF